MADEMILTEEEQQIEIKRLSDEVNKLQLRIQEQLSEIAELHKKNTDIYMEIGVVEQSLAGVEGQLLEAQQEREQLEAENMDKEKRLSEWQKKYTKVNAENEQLRLQINEHALRAKVLEEQIFQMENSKSWRITKPLRTFLWKHHRK